ncbi:MAG: hypothetical protein M1479_07945 [Actinobacteria bacterium]|nr:hypothetical protein [Actinomycetota bacterium]
MVDLLNIKKKNLNINFYNIIPTPKYIKKLDINLILYKLNKINNIFLIGAFDEKTKFAGTFLAKITEEKYGVDFKINLTSETNFNQYNVNDVIIINAQNLKEINNFLPDRTDINLFEISLAEKQGYILKISDNQPIILCAKSGIGCLYAVSTLLQLFRVEDENFFLPQVTIKDFPDFEYRGNTWNIWVEFGVWSYDRGDGIEAYTRRIITKLDMSLLYKINVIFIDGIGWNANKFPGYSEMMKEINSEARKRGIYLAYTGMGSGYGASGQGIYNGNIYKNREYYPDGKEYFCLGAYENNSYGDYSKVSPSNLGTCFSNNELMLQKKNELKRFVKSVEPGIIYIINLDIEDIKQSEEMWKLRCSSCKKRWPNDAVISKDGMAGAYAYFYNCLIDAVKNVKKDSYDSERDCLVIVASPAYMMPYHNDAEWKRALKYWGLVSNLMDKRKGVFITFREQYYNHSSNIRRIPQIKEALEKGNGHGVFTFVFYGADGAYNDQLFICSPSVSQIFLGADILAFASGNAYQEPLQLLNAEYAWNSKSSRFYRPKIPLTYVEFDRLFEKFKEAKIRPKKIYGKGGFIDIACNKLYGRDAGKGMSKLFKLRGKNNEPSVPYIWNWYLQDLNVWSMVPFQYYSKLIWGSDIVRRDIYVYISRFKELERVTKKAKLILSNTLSDFNLKGQILDDISFYCKSLERGVIFSKYFRQYMGIYLKAFDYFKNSKENKIEKKNLINKINNLLKYIQNTEKQIINSNLEPIDYLGGAFAFQKKALEYLSINLRNIYKSICKEKIIASEWNFKNWW